MKIEIEQVSPAFERVVSANPEYEMLPYGFGPEASPEDDSRAHGGIFPNPGEGPVWWKEGGFLVWSDIGHSRTMKWVEGEEFSVFREPTNCANGLTQGQARQVGCLRTGTAPGDPHRTRRQRHGHRQQVYGHEAQSPQRRGRNIGWINILHRSRSPRPRARPGLQRCVPSLTGPGRHHPAYPGLYLAQRPDPLPG